MISAGSEMIKGTDFQSQVAPIRRAADDIESRWYAAQTRARHEKCVAKQLVSRGVNSYVPLYGRTSKWKDRRVRLHVPLFAGYVFIHMVWTDRARALEVPGVTRLVSFGGRPVAIPDEEIESIRASLESGLNVEPTRYVAVGQRVRISSGPLEGFEGYLSRRKGSCRLILSVPVVQRSIAVEIDAVDVSVTTGPVFKNISIE